MLWKIWFREPHERPFAHVNIGVWAEMNSEALFAEACKVTVHRWTALNLAVHNDWGQGNSSEKRDNMVAEICSGFAVRTNCISTATLPPLYRLASSTTRACTCPLVSAILFLQVFRLKGGELAHWVLLPLHPPVLVAEKMTKTPLDHSLRPESNRSPLFLDSTNEA
jgi:hypothetical protein